MRLYLIGYSVGYTIVAYSHANSARDTKPFTCTRAAIKLVAHLGEYKIAIIPTIPESIRDMRRIIELIAAALHQLYNSRNKSRVTVQYATVAAKGARQSIHFL